MKVPFFHRLAIMAVIIFLSSCQQPGESPRVWFDQPLNNSEHKLEPITLQAHASDSDGISLITFSVGTEVIQAVDLAGGRMENAVTLWMPPGPGKFALYVIAEDRKGNSGMPASVTIIIAGQISASLPEAPVTIKQVSEETSGEMPEDKEVPEQIQISEDVPVSVIAGRDINCRKGPGTQFEIVTYLKRDVGAAVTGRLADNTWLLISHPDSGIFCWIAASIVNVNGDLESIPVELPPTLPQNPVIAEEPKEEPSAPQPQPDPQPETDTSSPIITAVWVNPQVVFQNGCTGDAQTTILTVEAIDIGGITNVEAAWSVNGLSGYSILNYVGANRYSATLGPFSKTGTLTIYGSVIDGGGNWTPFSITAEVDCCVC